jgi:hypothetical protein
MVLCDAKKQHNESQKTVDCETKHITMREEEVLSSITEASQQREAPRSACLSS